MPKLKTHKGTAKRVKKTASGKLLRERAYGNHLLKKKTPGRKRVISKSQSVHAADTRNIKRALGK